MVLRVSLLNSLGIHVHKAALKGRLSCMRSDLLRASRLMVVRVAAGDFADEAVDAMDASGGGQEHEGALTGHDFNSPPLAKCNCFWADGTFPGGAVHPNQADTGFGAVGDDLVGNGGRGHEERGCDGGLDVLQASKATPAQHIGSVGIHRNNIVPATAEFFEERDAEIVGFAGDPDHRNSFLSQEVIDRFQRHSLSCHVPSRAGVIPEPAFMLDQEPTGRQ